MKAVFTFFFLMFFFFLAKAQSSYYGGVHFEIKPAFSFQNDWKLNTRFSSRTYLFNKLSTEPFTNKFDHEREEFELLLTKKTSFSTSFGGGYLIRDQRGILKQRLIQQFSISKTYQNLSLGHRFRIDETFQKGEATSFRFRYRLSFEKPLKNGDEKVYLIFKSEYIPSLQDSNYKMEVRIFPGLGFNLNENNRLETGLDYRVENLFTDSHKQIYLFYLSWIPSF